MSGRICNGWLEGRLRFLLGSAAAVAVAVAAVVVFAWRSQAAQDEKIGKNRTDIAVIDTRLDAVGTGLGNIDKKLGVILGRLPE